MGKNRFSGKPG